MSFFRALDAGRVSVVIPTVGRPELTEAVVSALGQDEAVLEVLVCLDADVDISGLLPPDPRVRVLRVGPGAGGNVARQDGIESASGDLIALLDDDDVWLPTKLSQQLRLVTEAVRSSSADWIGTTRLIARSPQGDEVWPAGLISEGERVSEYVFRKHRPRGGQGFIQASTLLFPKRLALRVPFDRTLRFHQDVDWLLAVDQQTPNLRVVQSPDPLVIYRIGTSASVSGGTGISAGRSVEWAVRRIRDDPRSLGDFILTTSVIYAARRGEPVEVLRTIGKGVKHGSPGVAAFGYAMYRLVMTSLASMRRRVPHLRPPRFRTK